MRNEPSQLEVSFFGAEVHETLKLIGPLKAPGLDGFKAGFYQDHWNIVGLEVCLAVLDFLNGGCQLLAY